MKSSDAWLRAPFAAVEAPGRSGRCQAMRTPERAEASPPGSGRGVVALTDRSTPFPPETQRLTAAAEVDRQILRAGFGSTGELRASAPVLPASAPIVSATWKAPLAPGPIMPAQSNARWACPSVARLQAASAGASRSENRS